MTTRKDSQTFVPSFRFVTSSDRDERKKSRLHAMRESARKHRWLRDQDRVSPVDDSTGDSSLSSDGSASPAPVRSRRKPGSLAWQFHQLRASSQHTFSSREDDEKSDDSILDICIQKPTSILAGNTDPFGAYPAPNTNHHLDHLVDYCKICFDFHLLFHQLSDV
jgi:hypothetical protein